MVVIEIFVTAAFVKFVNLTDSEMLQYPSS